MHNWLTTLIATILLTSFLELMLPESQLRQFVKVVLGIFVIVTVMSPLTALRSEKINFEHLMLRASGQDYTEKIAQQSKRLTEVTSAMAEDQYVEEIKKQVRALALLVNGVADAKAEVVLDKKDNQEIEKLKVLLKTAGQFSQIVAVKPIQVGKQEEQQEDIDQRLLLETVRQAVGNFYHLRKEQVETVLLD